MLSLSLIKRWPIFPVLYKGKNGSSPDHIMGLTKYYVPLTPTTAEVLPVDHPNKKSLCVALDSVIPCYDEIEGGAWFGHGVHGSKKQSKLLKECEGTENPVLSEYTGLVTKARVQVSTELTVT